MKRMLKSLLSIGELFIVLIIGKLFGISLVVRYLRNPNPQVTVKLLRSFGAKIGNKTTFKRSLFIDNAYEDENSAGDFRHLNVGNNCYIGDCVFFDLSNEIEIEENVVISGQVSFITHSDCNRSKYLSTKFPRSCQPVKINNGAWVGFRAILLSGVTVGHHAVVASNALLREDAEPKAVYAGIPATKIKSIDDNLKCLTEYKIN